MHVAAAASLIALLLVVGSLIRLHLLDTGLSPVRNAVSQYGISSRPGGYRVATLAFAAAGVALAFALSDATDGRASATVRLLVVFALARAVISWFPMDAPGSALTRTGLWHGVLAILAFGGVTAAALKLAHALARQSLLHGLAPTSTALGVLMAVLLLSMWLSRRVPVLQPRFGLVERAFYGCAITWFAVFAVACLLAA